MRERAKFFRQVARENGLTVGGDEESPVASLIVGDDKLAMMLSHSLLERGIEVQPIVRPAVSATTARLRFFLTANHTEEQILETVPVVAQELEKLRRGVRLGMARTAFFVSAVDQPHPARTQAILKAHPEIRELDRPQSLDRAHHAGCGWVADRASDRDGRAWPALLVGRIADAPIALAPSPITVSMSLSMTQPTG